MLLWRMHPFFNVSGPISSLTLLRLINVLDEKKTEPDSPKDVNDKYDAFLKILEVRLVSAPLNIFLTCSRYRGRPISLCQKVMCNS
jgi:hypothetical protein